MLLRRGDSVDPRGHRVAVGVGHRQHRADKLLRRQPGAGVGRQDELRLLDRQRRGSGGSGDEEGEKEAQQKGSPAVSINVQT